MEDHGFFAMFYDVLSEGSPRFEAGATVARRVGISILEESTCKPTRPIAGLGRRLLRHGPLRAMNMMREP